VIDGNQFNNVMDYVEKLEKQLPFFVDKNTQSFSIINIRVPSPPLTDNHLYPQAWDDWVAVGLGS